MAGPINLQLVDAFTRERVLARFAIDSEERIATLDRAATIESGCPGWKVGGRRHSAESRRRAVAVG